MPASLGDVVGFKGDDAKVAALAFFMLAAVAGLDEFKFVGVEGEEILVLCNFGSETEIELPDGCERMLGNYPAHESRIFSPYEAAVYKIKK